VSVVFRRLSARCRSGHVPRPAARAGGAKSHLMRTEVDGAFPLDFVGLWEVIERKKKQSPYASCRARRSDDTDARKEARRCFRRSDKRARSQLSC
jgi:hypothetical protein